MEKLEYIESTGSQNLILDFVPTIKTRIQVGIMPTCVSGGSFIDTYGWSSSYGQFRLFNNNSKFYYDYGASRVSNGKSTFYKHQYYDIEMGNKYINSNNTLIASTTAISSYEFNSSLELFCNDKVRFYYIKIYDIGESGNEELLRSYIPALDENEIPCLFEEVNNIFYYQENIDEQDKELFIIGKYNIYDSIQSAIDADVNNMEPIVVNKAIPMGSGICFFPGADWLSINNKVCKYLYVNSHSYIGFNENKKELAIYSSDYIYMQNIWREIGTISGRNFVKISYEGYPIQISEANKIRYDVFLFDTGDIFIYLQPTKNIYATLESSSFVSTAETYSLQIAKTEQYVSLYKISTLNNYNITKKIISFDPVVSTIEKMLFSTIDGYYTIKDGEFIFLTTYIVEHWNDETENVVVEEGVVEDNTPAILNAELFKKCGFLDIPTQTQLIDFYNYINIESENLKDFDLLGWWDNSLASAELLLNINALPYEQSLETNTVKIPYSTKVNYYTAVGIEKVEIDCEGDILFKVNFKNGTESETIWKHWDGGTWVSSNDTELVGMSAAMMESITTEQWQTLFDGSKYIQIKMFFTEKNQKFNSLILTYKVEKVKNNN